MIVFLRFIQFCFRIIFFLPVSISLNIMYGTAWLTQAIAKRTRLRKIVIENIKMLMPESKPDKIADRLIANFSYSIFEVLCVPFFRKKHFQTIFRWQGLENIDQALKGEKGAIILTIHAGNYEIIPAALTNLGYKMNVVLRATEDPIFEIVNRARGKGGTKLINIVGDDMFKESVKAMRENEIIGLLADTGALESRHEFFKFLGRDVPVATGWLTLAQRYSCPVVPILSKREGKAVVATLFEPVKVTKDTREQAMQKIGKIFEDYIKQNPDQWAMFLNEHETKRMVRGR